jgi:glycosyltransferase involved in cell wall biosynthesis
MVQSSVSHSADGDSSTAARSAPRPRVLALVHLPPPTHGASVMSSAAVDALSQEFDVVAMRISAADGIAGIGQVSLRKSFAMIGMLFRLIGTLLVRRYSLVYITLAPTTSAFIKDATLLAIARVFVPRALIHLHGKGVKLAADESSLMRWLYRRVFNLGAVIHLSETLSSDVAWTGTRVTIVANGVAVPTPAAKDRSIDVLFLSNLVESKGPMVLLLALKQLAAEGHPLNVIFCGRFEAGKFKVEFLDELARMPGNVRIELIEGRYGDAKFELLQRAKIVTLPTHYPNECFPISLIEAMGSGAAIVSTPEGAIPEMIPTSIGVIVKQRDIEGLAAALRQLLADPAQLSAMGARARERYEALYTDKVFAQRLQAAVRHELARSRT